jgi:hypothetical protein
MVMPTVAVLLTIQAADQLVVQGSSLAGVQCLFAVQEQWATAVLPQVVVVWAPNVGTKPGILTVVNVPVQTLTVMQVADVNSSKVLILPAHQAVAAVTAIFLVTVVAGTVFANAITG